MGGIGKVLIVIGLLLFAFVAYQLWGTGIYTAQAQNELHDQFDHAGIDATTAPTSTVPATTAPPATAAGTTAATSTTTAATTTTTTSGPEQVPYPFPPADVGDPLVHLRIPSIGVDHIVVQGVGLDQLKKGPGHFPESVLPGQLGNAAIAGHRTTYGAPFYDVDHLRPGDTIILTYPDIGGQRGPQFTYVVTGTDIVSPSDYALVVPTTDPTRATLVLSSCHPISTARQRIIVRAELDPTRSSTLFAPTPTSTPTAGGDGTQVLPGDDTGTDAGTASTGPSTSTSPSTSDATGTPAPATAGPTLAPPSDGAGSVPATAGTTAGAAAATPPSASEDAFAGGWFDDGAAWPQILVWGLLLAAIAFGGYVLAKRQRRIWLGVLVSFVPFLVVLYFWFENVNRLLPPGL